MKKETIAKIIAIGIGLTIVIARALVMIDINKELKSKEFKCKQMYNLNQTYEIKYCQFLDKLVEKSELNQKELNTKNK